MFLLLIIMLITGRRTIKLSIFSQKKKGAQDSHLWRQIFDFRDVDQHLAVVAGGVSPGLDHPDDDTGRQKIIF